MPNDWKATAAWTCRPTTTANGAARPPARGQRNDDDDAPTALDLAGSHESLTDFLHQQALSLRLSEIDRYALRFLIENLNDDGYLEDSLQELAEGLAGTDDLEQLDELVHRFTGGPAPAAVSWSPWAWARATWPNACACNCCTCTARTRRTSMLEVALQVCAQPLDMLARRDVRNLTQACGLPEAKARAALGVIARLEPKPGRRFADVERHIIVPDVMVKKTSRKGGDGLAQFSVQLNPDVMPRLRVHDVYANALRSHKGSDGHAGLQQRLQEARWFIKNVQQRFDTILRVSKAIVERQKNFFVHGELAMRPLVLRDIADELGLHESTISRVTTAKYMATPHGTYELKYFFGSGLGTETGRQCLQHGGARADQAVRGRRKHRKSRCRTARWPRCSRSRALSARAAPWPSTAKRSKIAPANLRKA